MIDNTRLTNLHTSQCNCVCMPSILKESFSIIRTKCNNSISTSKWNTRVPNSMFSYISRKKKTEQKISYPILVYSYLMHAYCYCYFYFYCYSYSYCSVICKKRLFATIFAQCVTQSYWEFRSNFPISWMYEHLVQFTDAYAVWTLQKY
jgi:hypothetical protein